MNDRSPELLERHQRIATVMLNNPDRLNALTRAMWDALAERMAEVDADPDLRAVVLRGAGQRAFAAGADISEFATARADVEQASDYGAAIHRAIDSVRRLRHPTIAMIHGSCIGGGLEIAAVCDLRICGASSRFGVPVKNLGLTMAYGELAWLIDLVGRAVALEIVLEGRIFGADEAREKGLVTRVVADDAVEAEAVAAATRIADGAPLVARWHKKFARRLADTEPLTAVEYYESFACFGTEDFRVGHQAFLSKTKPEFKGL